MSKLAHSNEETMNLIETEARQREEAGVRQDPRDTPEDILDNVYWKTEKLVNLGHRLSAGELFYNKLRLAGYELKPIAKKYTSVDLVRSSRLNGDFPPHKNCKKCGTA